MASVFWWIFLALVCRSTADHGALLQISHSGNVKGKHQVLVPKPLKHLSGHGELQVTHQLLQLLKDYAKSVGPETWRIVNAQFFSRLARLAPKGPPASEAFGDFQVNFVRRIDGSDDPHDRQEGYFLMVAMNGISIDASSSWALANAMATLYQLLEVAASGITIPGCPHYIEDKPSFVHRGVLLDVSRQWIKGLIAALAEFKINVLHLHLTDTASWPLEIEGYPEIARKLSYRDINGKALTYSRQDIRNLVEFARLRGVAILPEIDGPMHAPALAAALNWTVAATVNFSLPKFAYEPPPGTWNISSTNALDFVRSALKQVEEDFSTAPFLHVGGDEPTAASLCVLLDQPLRQQCWEQCTSTSAHGCAPVPKKPKATNVTWWFPEYLNAKVQHYFDGVIPSPAKIPRVAWSGAVTDTAVQLPPTGLKQKSALQLWTFPAESEDLPAISEEDCAKYDLIQSAATYPVNSSTYGWLYMDCGSGANWISMGPDYWCPHASWAALYALNSTQGYGTALKTPRCQKAFLGAEMALWSEIGGMGNGMALIFPRAAAFAERMWSNPEALAVEQMTGGQPPEHYWQSHLKDALARLNQVVANFDLLHLGVSHLQPEFCRVHPEYCNEYTSGFYARKRYKKKKHLRLDEETGEAEAEEDESFFQSVRGIGILVVSLVAGFSVASLVLLSPWKALTDTAPQQLQLGHLGPVAIESEENWSWEPAATSAPSAPAAPVAAMVPPPEVKVVKLPASRQPGNFNDPRVLWVHLHSYGGTTICDLARAHGEKVSAPKDNCNIMPDGCSTPKSFRIPCKKRAASMQYTFSAVERVLDEDDLRCSRAYDSQNMLFGIMLRDPVAGLKSTLIGNEFEKGVILTTLRSHVAMRNMAFHFCLPPFDTYQHFDNFAVRSLSDYDVPPGEVTRQHLEKAKGVLSKLDVVLIMEDLTEHLPQLRAVFGWDVDLDRSPWHSHWHRIPKNVFSVQEAAFLKEVNHLDYELYEFAQTLARQLTAQALQRLSRT